MLNCRQVTRLVSRSLDARLPWPQRLGVRLHLLYCVWCRRYVAQVRFLREATRQLARKAEDAPAVTLPPQAREHVRARLRQAWRENPPPSA